MIRFRFLSVAFGATALAGALTGCNKGDAGGGAFNKTKSGLEYKLFRPSADGKYSDLALADLPKTDSAKQLRAGKVLMLQQIVRNGKDSVLSDTRATGMPQPYMLNPQQPSNILDEPMRMLAAGDSGVFRVPSDSIFTKKNMMMGFQRPKFIPAGSFLTMYIKAERVMSLPDAQAEMQRLGKAMEEKQNVLDTKTLADYVAKEGIQAEKLPTGVYVAVTKPGTGAKPKPGEMVAVSYKGTLLDGKQFDASLRDGKDTPYEYAFDQGQVIAGWDQGIAMLQKGAKATILVPSSLGYGTRGSGPIPPNSPLRFDVELVDIKPAPAPTGMPKGMPMPNGAAQQGAAPNAGGK